MTESTSYNPRCPVPPGTLDGVTIMRYAHQYRGRNAGGVEQYLRQLNHELLQRHRITILQTHLVDADASTAIDVERVGLGYVVWLPIVIHQADSAIADLPWRLRYIWTDALRRSRERSVGSPWALGSAVREILRDKAGHVRYRAAIFSGHLRGHLTENVDLLALHWLSYDTGRLISRSIESGVPFVIVNHFGNHMLSFPEARGWLNRASGLGGVSARDVPDRIRRRFVNLSDAIDCDFFCPEKARPVGRSGAPMILLPARIDTGKGHRDLVQAARILRAGSIDFVLGFVGAIDSETVCKELRRSIAESDMEGRALFLGEVDAEQMRDWYAASAVVVLPSRSEGLGRVLLEAQAMKKPVVAYDSGGIAEAVLPDRTGFLVKAGDIDSMANRIALLLRNERQCRHMGECGREFVSRQFGVPSLADRHEAFYLSSLASSSRFNQRGATTQRVGNT